MSADIRRDNDGRVDGFGFESLLSSSEELARVGLRETSGGFGELVGVDDREESFGCCRAFALG